MTLVYLSKNKEVNIKKAKLKTDGSTILLNTVHWGGFLKNFCLTKHCLNPSRNKKLGCLNAALDEILSAQTDWQGWPLK